MTTLQAHTLPAIRPRLAARGAAKRLGPALGFLSLAALGATAIGCVAGAGEDPALVSDCRLEALACTAGQVCSEAFDGYVCVEREPEAPDVLVDPVGDTSEDPVDPALAHRALCDAAAQRFLDCLRPVCGAFGTHQEVSDYFCSLPEGEANLEYYAAALCFDLRGETCGQDGWECSCPEPPAEPVAPDEGDFRVAWDPPDSAVYREFETYLREANVIDQWVRWLNQTYKLPYSIQIQHEECGRVNAFYYNRKVHMCYEYLQAIADYWYGTNYTPAQASEAILGTWKAILLHEVGHAIVDAYDLPVTGQEEDAVDEFAALSLIASAEGRSVVYLAYFHRARSEDDPSLQAYADEHSLGIQRFYNMLCSVYGYAPEENAWILDRFPEMAARAERCPYEYRQKRASWDALLSPWVQ